ncbi:MAG: hypothetical protein EPN39_13155 [Chitinophagaceae bacterium]|jgi:hypothetical protein|nr:MAG: hypothetical protein EPN39_13155 [Chitinophagaceae bacterium]
MKRQEFKILFRYDGHSYLARVVKSIDGHKTLYAIRPKAILLARAFGRQTLIFKEDEQYSCESKINARRPEYVEALTKALKAQDILFPG